MFIRNNNAINSNAIVLISLNGYQNYVFHLLTFLKVLQSSN